MYDTNIVILLSYATQLKITYFEPACHQLSTGTKMFVLGTQTQ